MIKKSIYILTIIIAVVLSSLTYTAIINLDRCKINGAFDYYALTNDKETINYFLTFDKDVNIDEFLDDCIACGNTFGIYGYTIENGINYSSRYLYSRDENILVDKIDIKKQIDFSDSDICLYYSTNPKDTYSSGTFYTIDLDYYNNLPDQKRIQSIRNFAKDFNNVGDYSFYIFGNNRKDTEGKIEQIFDKYNVAYENMTDGYSPVQFEQIHIENDNKIRLIFFLASLSIVVMMVIFVLKKRRNIMIQRLHGVSILSIMLTEFGLFAIIDVIVFALSMVSYALINVGIISKYNIDFYQKIPAYTFIYFICLLIFFIIVYVFMHHLTHLKYLKSKYSMKYVVELNVLLKVCVICLLISPLSTSLGTLTQDFTQYTNYKKNETLLSHLGHTSGYARASDKRILFDYFNVHGGLYIDFNTWLINSRDYLVNEMGITDESQLRWCINYPFIIANENYLKTYDIKDIHGNPINYDQYEKDIILVPKRLRNEDSSKIMFGENLEVIEIQDNGVFVNYGMSEPYTMKNPMIRVIHTLSLFDNANMYMDFNTYDKGTCQKDLYTLTGSHYNVESLHTECMYLIKNMKTELKEMFDNSLLFFIFLILMIYQMSFMYINENQMKLSLQYMHGQSFIKRYIELFIYTCVSYIVAILLGVMLLHLKYTSLMNFILFCVIFECIIQYILIYNFERKNIANILKGEANI